MKQSDFNAEVEEDFGIGFECEDCGNTGSYEEYEEEENCPECQSTSILQETSHDGVDCVVCKTAFDMWEDGHRSKTSKDLVCTYCYDELEE